MTSFRRILSICFAVLSASIAAYAADASAGDATGLSSVRNSKYPLRHILIAESIETAQQLSPAPDTPFVSLASTLNNLDSAELTKRLSAAQSQIIDDRLLSLIVQAIEIFARQRNFPHASAIIPTQSIADGVVRIALILNPPLIRQIIIAESIEEAQTLAPSPDAGLLVLSPRLTLSNREELVRRLAQAENQPFQEKLVAAIAQVVEIFFRQNDFPLATPIVPPQSGSDGILRIAVQRGRIRNIKVTGNRWFSDSLLREKLRIEHGELLRGSELEQALNWTNNNPFRHVRVLIDPVAGTGEADLTIAVQEALPLRAQLAYDNGGNEIMGESRFTGSATYANLWGLDHQVSYQFVTSELGPKIFQAHGLDYRIPLPWRDHLQVSASYLTAQPTFGGGHFTQDAVNVTTNVRYSHPLRTGNSPIEVYAGLDFKQSNNNIAFGGAEAFSSKTDIFQFSFGGSMIHRDKRGAWAFGANVSLSPGRINSRNSAAVFHEPRALADPDYIYGQLTFQRLLNLPHGWNFTSRGIIQMSDSNLLSSEQLYIGGASSVRGFDENIFGSDSGFLLTNELHAPVWKTRAPLLPKNRNGLETRFLGFYDAAHVRPKFATNLDPEFVPLASAGVGVRMNVANNLSLSADYGWQITHLPYETDQSSRGHIRATLAF